MSMSTDKKKTASTSAPATASTPSDFQDFQKELCKTVKIKWRKTFSEDDILERVEAAFENRDKAAAAAEKRAEEAEKRAKEAEAAKEKSEKEVADLKKEIEKLKANSPTSSPAGAEHNLSLLTDDERKTYDEHATTVAEEIDAMNELMRHAKNRKTASSVANLFA